MRRKLNYIFSQVLDNYKAAYKDNRAFYIGFGLLFVFINAMVYIGMNALGFLIFGTKPEHNIDYLMYSYLLLLTLPCLAILKQEDEPLKFRETLSQNMTMLIVLGSLATMGFFFIGGWNDLLNHGWWDSLEALLGILGQIFIIFMVLFLLRAALKKPIALLDRLKEAFILTVFLAAVIQAFQSFFYYGLMESFRYIFSTDVGEFFLTPILFILVNLLLSPLLVCIITTVIRYEEAPEVIIETTNNEAL